MGFFLKWKTRSQRQASGTIVAVVMVVLGVLTYLLIPSAMAFLNRALVGGKGILYLLAGGVVLEIWFLIMGYRGKALVYALLVLIFTILCIWLAINFDMVWDSMINTLGLWPTIILCLLGALGLWLVMTVFL